MAMGERAAAIQAFFEETFLKAGRPPPTFSLLGGEIISFDAEKGRLENTFRATSDMVNPAGTIQGGIITALMDDTMGPLVMIMTRLSQMPASLDIHTQYHRPAKPGTLRCVATINQLSRNVATTRAELFDSRDRLLASAIQTAMLSPINKST